MEFRSVFIANPAQLSVRRGQLVIRQEGEYTLPMEDLSALVLESRAVSLSAAALQELADQGFGPYYIDHTTGIWPQAAGGVPFNACEFQSKGDVITDLHEDLAAEQKARSTYDNILRVVRDYDVCEPIRFLRERGLVHYQTSRFGELLRITQEKLDSRNFYAFNPAFDPSSWTQSSQG